MSPRIKDIPDGNKHPVQHPEEQNAITLEPTAPNGSVFSSFLTNNKIHDNCNKDSASEINPRHLNQTFILV
jgi:hypothetical protein